MEYNEENGTPVQFMPGNMP